MQATTTELLRQLIEGAPQGVAVAQDGRFAFVNAALRAALGADAGAGAALVGSLVAEVAHADDRRALEGLLADVLRSRAARPRQDLRFVGPGGEIRTLEVHAQPIDYESAPAVVLYAHDVTECRALATRLTETDRMAALGTLAAGVAHEINNPLTYVVGSLEVAEQALEAASAPEVTVDAAVLGSIRSHVANAREGIDRVRSVVRDLRTFSRADDDVRVPVAIDPVLSAALHLARGELTQHARLVTDFSGACTVRGNPTRLGQVFLNLLLNAAHAVAEAGGGDHEIRARTRRSATGDAIVEIEDTGVGVPLDAQSQIFEPFWTTKPVGVGTGLGLSICRGIVSGLGGTITVESTPGRGSTFRVTLPTTAETPTAPTPVPITRGPGPAKPRARLLVIDDEPRLGQTLRLAFAGKHEVVLATSGREGLERIQREGPFDLVLCDLMMPDLGGIAIYEEVVRSHPELEARFVVMTGGAFTARAREFVESGKTRLLEKPFTVEALEALLAELARPRGARPRAPGA
jgi:PAS domain S-box-containing protein